MDKKQLPKHTPQQREYIQCKLLLGGATLSALLPMLILIEIGYARCLILAVQCFNLFHMSGNTFDGALITAAIRMNRKLYKWSGGFRRLQTWNMSESRFDVIDEMMPVELLEWFRDLDEKAILLLEDGHMLLDQTTLNVASSILVAKRTGSYD